MSNNKERSPKHLKFPSDLVHRIKVYQAENNIKTFSGTVYHLIRLGLDSSDKH